MPTVSEEKQKYEKRMNALMDEYSKILFCDIDNVQSQQMHDVRNSLRGKAEVLVGKKTLQKRIVTIRAESDSATDADKALKRKLCDDEMLVGNLCLIFTNENVDVIQKILSGHRVQAPARTGGIAPCEVIVPAGNTGLEPTMTSFFQALSIPTKIAKGTVEIISDKLVLKPGDKVDASTAALLGKLKISPFFYQVDVRFFFEKGLMFGAEDLAVTDKSIEDAFMGSISNLTAASLETGLLTDLSFPHALMDGFKNLLGAAAATDYVFEEYNGKELIANIKSGKAVGAAAAPAASAAAAPAAGKKEAAPAKKEESEDDGGMDMGLFD